MSASFGSGGGIPARLKGRPSTPGANIRTASPPRLSRRPSTASAPGSQAGGDEGPFAAQIASLREVNKETKDCMKQLELHFDKWQTASEAKKQHELRLAAANAEERKKLEALIAAATDAVTRSTEDFRSHAAEHPPLVPYYAWARGPGSNFKDTVSSISDRYRTMFHRMEAE